MRHRHSGYTIVEVMIVLGISGVLLLSALALFSGQSKETGFDQGTHDAASEILTKVKEVGSSLLPNATEFTCTLDAGRPVLDTGGSPDNQGSNGQCVVLGKAFEAASSDNTIYIYTVLGKRAASSGEIVTKLSDAGAEPVINGVGNNVDLTEKYQLPNGVKIISSQVRLASSGTFDARSLVGYYTNLQGDATSGQNGSQLLTIKGYNYNSTNGYIESMIKDCIEQVGLCATPPADIDVWRLCLSDPDGLKSAVLDVASSSSGLTTSLKFISCS